MSPGTSPGLTPGDARAMLSDLQEETARLSDPAGWQFVGGDRAADARAADALAAQLDGVPALRRLAPTLAEAAGRDVGQVLATVDDYEQATRTALERTRSGRAPEQPPTVQVAPTSDPSAPTEDSTQPPPAPAAASTTGMGTAESPPPSLRSAAVVAAVVLVVVVVVVAVLLLAF